MPSPTFVRRDSRHRAIMSPPSVGITIDTRGARGSTALLLVADRHAAVAR
jgi:hypothetical protein